MIINLTEIYKGLKAWRDERHISVESQKEGYLVNVMEEFGELSQALRGLEYENTRKVAEHEIIDALCDIAIFTINSHKEKIYREVSFYPCFSFGKLLRECGNFGIQKNSRATFKHIIVICANLCEKYGYNFEIAMLETIKEISSRTGSYDETSKKWVKDTSPEARALWYKADYERAKIK